MTLYIYEYHNTVVITSENSFSDTFPFSCTSSCGVTATTYMYIVTTASLAQYHIPYQNIYMYLSKNVAWRWHLPHQLLLLQYVCTCVWYNCFFKPSPPFLFLALSRQYIGYGLYYYSILDTVHIAFASCDLWSYTITLVLFDTMYMYVHTFCSSV